jgi:hypothetical protein
MGKFALLVVVVAIAVPVGSGTASPLPPVASGQFNAKGIVSSFVAPSTVNGTLVIKVTSATGSGTGLRGQTIMVAVTPQTKIVYDRDGKITDGETVALRVTQQALLSGPSRLVATEVVDLGHGFGGPLPPVS